MIYRYHLADKRYPQNSNGHGYQLFSSFPIRFLSMAGRGADSVCLLSRYGSMICPLLSRYPSPGAMAIEIGAPYPFLHRFLLRRLFFPIRFAFHNHDLYPPPPRSRGAGRAPRSTRTRRTPARRPPPRR